MKAGELRELLALLPDDFNVLIDMRNPYDGPCHVSSVWKASGGITLNGMLNFRAVAPEVELRGRRWPKKPPAAKKPVDRDAVVRGLVGLLR